MPLDLEKALAADYEAVAAAIEQRYGRLDGLLHNAALLGALTPIEQYDVPMFMRVMHVNVTAAFVLTQQPAAAAARIEGRRGAVHVQRRGQARSRLLGRLRHVEVRSGRFHAGAGAGARRTRRTVRVNIIDPGKVRTSMRRAGLSIGGPADTAHAGVADGAVSGFVRPGQPGRDRAALQCAAASLPSRTRRRSPDDGGAASSAATSSSVELTMLAARRGVFVERRACPSRCASRD